MNNKPLLLIVLALLLPFINAEACTNFICSRGASADGSTMITYAADSHTRYGQLRYHRGGTHQAGETVKLYNYGSLKFQIEIPQAAVTYNVVGFINEHQLAIGETTWGGISPLDKGNAEGIDYGNLIYLALQRAKNCREAIKVMAELVETYGYADGGESFSLADPNEVWILEITSKGPYEKGAVWVARRVPDGYVCGHANQARITTFPQEPLKWKKKVPHPAISSKHIDCIYEPEVECVYSEDVIFFALKHSEFEALFDGDEEGFSFADVYNPLTFSGLRACESRVYAMFNRCADDMKKYEAYAMGDPIAERLPLWVKPNRKLSVQDVMELMRDHFEGTPMDMNGDVGAGPFHCPYRWRPMDFEVDGKKYVHERAISTQQTGFSFVAQCRSWLPDKLGGIIWFGVDDTYSTVYCPMFCGITQVPVCFEEGNGSMAEYSETSAFWLFNRVSNFCYLRYDSMIVDVRRVQKELEQDFTKIVDGVSREYENYDDARLVAAINKTSNRCADQMMRRWTQLDRFLLMKYIDGNIKNTENERIKTTPTGVVAGLKQPPYPQWFYEMIVRDKGEILKVRE
ncbi:MAG: C69 family dipeptidase [Bacteroidales bacterium]|nr:C69 family dipeptidase [Bacteroidales bacterium]